MSILEPRFSLIIFFQEKKFVMQRAENNQMNKLAPPPIK